MNIKRIYIFVKTDVIFDFFLLLDKKYIYLRQIIKFLKHNSDMKQIKCFLNEVYKISSQNKAQSALNVIDLSYSNIFLFTFKM